MKLMKKLASLALALVLVLAMGTPALAAQEGTLDGGSITISNTVSGQTYDAYQILYLESYDAVNNRYIYKANSAWESWLKSQTDYISIDATTGYVTWVRNLTCKNTEEGHQHTDACYTNADAAEFAKLAQTQVEAAGMSADATVTAAASTATLSDLKLGYYLVDSSLGSLCALDTTNPTATITDKNELPVPDKKVQEDSDNNWDKTNDADIGQTVNYKITVSIPQGSKNVTVHDTMSAGLTLTAGSIKVYTDEALSTEFPPDNYTVITTGLTDGCTFEVAFKQAYLDSLTAKTTTLYVACSATLNDKAVVGLSGNTNTSTLSYGNTGSTATTPPSTTTTYTWDLEVLKYANGNESNVLAGVKFVLLNKGKDKVATVVNGKLTGWVDVPAPVGGVITWPDNTTLTTDSNGKIKVEGLDADEYYLREIKALSGFNLLDEDFPVEIDGATMDNNELTYSTFTAKVNNQSGTELPSTGGIGTTIFYIVGGVLVLAAVVLLLTRKRMNREG